MKNSKDTPIMKRFKEFVKSRTGVPTERMRSIIYESGDFGVRVDGVGDISVLKTDFLNQT